MRFSKFVFRSLAHYIKSNVSVALGVAISTAVIAGALIVGDSMRYSLEQTARYRLGNITHTITAGDRYFTENVEMGFGRIDVGVSSILKQEAMALAQGGKLRINRVNVWGVKPRFGDAAGNDSIFNDLQAGEALISENLAARLNLEIGQFLQLKIDKASLVPLNAPFVSGDVQTVSTRVKVTKILERSSLGRLNMQNSQTAPFNVFVNFSHLNNLMEFNENRVNVLAISMDDRFGNDLLEETLNYSWSIEDAGLKLTENAVTGTWQLTSDRVFIDKPIVELLKNNFDAELVLTYFANSIELADRKTPYSFVSGMNNELCASDEIIINQWLADDLKAKEGDTIKLNFFEMGPLRELINKEAFFVVKEIVPIEGVYADQDLMPYIPGFSDAQNCRDWDTGVPIELDDIRDKDEQYWYDYKGTPKAFIARSVAEKLWSNRFGNATSIRFDQEKYNYDVLKDEINNLIGPEWVGAGINPVKEHGLTAARKGTDFGELFIGLSFFLLVAGILLTALLFLFNIEQRSGQIGTLKALGFTERKIWSLYMVEGILVSIVGVVLGLGLSILYNKAVFWGLNQIWYDIVRTQVLEPRIDLMTLLIGGLIGLVVAQLTIRSTFYRLKKRTIAGLQKRLLPMRNYRYQKLMLILSILLLIASLALMLAEFLLSKNLNPGNFFLSGGILLISLLLLFDGILKRNGSFGAFNRLKLLKRNWTAKPGQSLLVVLLLALGTFLTISTGMNRKDVFRGADRKSSGTGGFLFYAENTVPILNDLNDENYRKEQGYKEETEVIQFRIAEGDDASCLNLNLITNPRIISTDLTKLNGRFQFQTKTEQLDEDDPWSSFQIDYGDCIPALADQTVIQWGLGKKVGDTLVYRNALGNEVRLKLIGGLAASIFQGSVLVDERLFLEHFPSSSGSQVMLIDGDANQKETIADELNLMLRDFGLELSDTAQRLAEFKSIENTYLSIFMVLGGLGLIIGAIGLAIVLLRSMLERKSELATLLALGYRKKQILMLLVSEYFVLFMVGVGIGFITAIVSTLPIVLNGAGDVSITFPLVILATNIVNGLFWIVLLASAQLRKLQLVASLRDE